MPLSADFGAVGELAAASHGVISRQQAAQLGLTRHSVSHLVERGVVTRAAPGVLVVRGSPATWEQRLLVATLSGGSDALAITESSARLHRVDGLEDIPDLRVAVAPGRRLALDGVHVSQTAHTYEACDVVTIDGIRCSGLARTLCDLAAARDARLLERAVDDYQRRGLSLGWLEWTAQRLKARGRPGIPLVLGEVDRRRVGGRVRDSWFEKLVEECIASPKIPPIERQLKIFSEAGAFIARVDLAVPAVRLVNATQPKGPADSRGEDARRRQG